MKVKELIELLSKLDQDKEVMMEQNGGEYVSDLENMKVVEGDERVWLLD
jgi:hypothetical protein